MLSSQTLFDCGKKPRGIIIVSAPHHDGALPWVSEPNPFGVLIAVQVPAGTSFQAFFW
jgi:hypothetical protein